MREQLELKLIIDNIDVNNATLDISKMMKLQQLSILVRQLRSIYHSRGLNVRNTTAFYHPNRSVYTNPGVRSKLHSFHSTEILFTHCDYSGLFCCYRL